MGLREAQPEFFENSETMDKHEYRRRANLSPKERVREWANLRKRGGLTGDSIKDPDSFQIIPPSGKS